ncbi:MAG: 30S ribosomal protein S2 [Candidatus Paceibacterota bacterium]|jgi:small subunit ribosomal protein S2
MDKEKIIDEMFKAGAHFGYSKTKRHPSTGQYIFGTKNRNDIINLEKTVESLAKAEEYVKMLSSTGKVLLFIGIKPESKKALIEGAQSVDMPYVTERWIGGAFTNFIEIKKRIAIMEDLKDKREKGELDKYTKKERLLIDEKIAKLHRYFSGLVSMKKIPDAIFVIDAKKEIIAVTEAKKAGVPVIALCNTDTNIKIIDYPIIANDASSSSVTYFINAIVKAYKSGQTIKA